MIRISLRESNHLGMAVHSHPQVAVGPAKPHTLGGRRRIAPNAVLPAEACVQRLHLMPPARQSWIPNRSIPSRRFPGPVYGKYFAARAQTDLFSQVFLSDMFQNPSKSYLEALNRVSV